MTDERFFGVVGKVFRPVFYLSIVIIFYNSVTWVDIGSIPLAALTLNQVIGTLARVGFLFFLVWLVFNPKEHDPERWALWGAFGVLVVGGAVLFVLFMLWTSYRR